jgi:serine/threonine protein kinase
VAPEVLGGRGYAGFPADCWSVGVCLFILLSGYAPFSGADERAVLAAVKAAGRAGPADLFEDPAWEAVSGSARGLVRSLLDPNPATRATCAEALRHPWVAGAVVPSATERAGSNAGRPPLPSPSAWRPATLAVIAQRRLAALAAARQAAVAAAVAEGEKGETTLLGTRASAPLGRGGE